MLYRALEDDPPILQVNDDFPAVAEALQECRRSATMDPAVSASNFSKTTGENNLGGGVTGRT